MDRLGDEIGERYRVILICDGVPLEGGPQAAIDVTEEFTHRPWHQNVESAWDGKSLVLRAENDYDPNGTALMDEFSDAIAASVGGGFGYNISLVSAAKIA
ncbi:MAG TPA: hypothetical protein VNX18_15350 [Bryobacteraceae bacterium]|nr:hypothetical protein [Bryobacteraceae bacterium]